MKMKMKTGYRVPTNMTKRINLTGYRVSNSAVVHRISSAFRYSKLIILVVFTYIISGRKYTERKILNWKVTICFTLNE